MKLSAILVENKEISKYQKSAKIVEYVEKQTEGVEIPANMKLHPSHIQYCCEIIENQVNNKGKDKDYYFYN